MRVVVVDGPWPDPRIAGHYGKVTELLPNGIYNSQTNRWYDGATVKITGHVDGSPPGITDDFMRATLGDCVFFAAELEVID